MSNQISLCTRMNPILPRLISHIRELVPTRIQMVYSNNVTRGGERSPVEWTLDVRLAYSTITLSNLTITIQTIRQVPMLKPFNNQPFQTVMIKGFRTPLICITVLSEHLVYLMCAPTSTNSPYGVIIMKTGVEQQLIYG